MNVPDIQTPIRVGNRWHFADGKTLPVVSGGSDTGPAPAPAPAPAVPTAVVDPAAPPPDPAAPPDYAALYQREVADRVKERNLYKPYAQAFKDLQPDERQAILDLAGAVAAGDTDGVVDWTLQTAQNVSGKTAAELIAARQAAQAATPPTQPGIPTPAPAPPAPGYDPAKIEELVDQRVQRSLANKALADSYTATMKAAGYDPATPTGRAIIQICRDETRGDMSAAIAAFNADVMARTQAGVQGAAAVAGQLPAPAPGGAPAVTAPANLTPEEKMRQRFRQSATRA